MGKVRHAWIRRLTPLLMIVVMLTAVLPQPGLVRAADFSIPCAEGVGDSAALIAALAAANSNAQADLIQLGGTPEEPCTYTLFAVENAAGGPNGLPVVTSDAGNPLTIEGNGATIRRSVEAPAFRLLSVVGGNLTLRNLNLAGGLALGAQGQGSEAGLIGGFGGAIFNDGNLTLDRVTISASEARGGDGASRDSASSGGGGGGGGGLGGAIFNGASATLNLVNTTMSGNIARGGNGGAGGTNGSLFAGGAGGGIGGNGGIGPDPETGVGQPGASAEALSGGGGGGSGSDGNAEGSYDQGVPAAGSGGAGSFGGGGGGAGASRYGGSGGPGGAGGFGGGDGGASCCSYAAGGGGGAGLGGALYNDGGSVVISFSTLYDNTVVGGAGGTGSFGFGDGVSGDGLGGALFSTGGEVSYASSIIANNGGGECWSYGEAGFSSLGSNLLPIESGCYGDETDQFVNDPGLLPLADHGGGVLTHALGEGSPAVDAGGATCPDVDGRGFARPAGEACDSGAYESGAEAPSTELVVTTSADGGEGSLRDAIERANDRPGLDTISFNIDGGTIITLTSPLPALSGPTFLDALTQPGASAAEPLVTLDGSQLEAVADGLVLTGGASVVRGLVIVGFGGAGISVPSGVGTNLRENRFANDGLAIDLGADGQTLNDAGDEDNGPNDLQNHPSVTATEGPSSVVISGALDAVPGVYTVDIFASTACQLVDAGAEADARLSGPGQGERLIGTLTVDAGAPFSLPVEGFGLVGQWISAIATDAAGNTSEFSPCEPVRTNDLWPNALALDFAETGQDSIGQSISRPYQERWYKFPVGPGGRVRVDLTAPPGSILTLHRDIQTIYDQLSLPQSAEAVAANEQTSGFLPGAYLPGAYLPGAYLPGAYLPGAYLPGAYLPGAYLPGAYLPGAYLPGAYLPGAYLPGAYLPGAYLPGAYLPEQYSAAAVNSLMAFAADPGAEKLTIERNTWDLAENLYVRVVGPTDSSFTLHVTYQPGICAAVTAPDANLPVFDSAGPATSGTYQTLLLWDRSSTPAADQAGLEAGLLGFAQRPDVNGLVLDLAQQTVNGPRFPRVAAARATLADNASCVAAANILANEIKAVVDGHRKTNLSGATTTLKYVVLTGGDDVIPFFRYPDVAGLANENEYFPPVEDISQSNAALREGRVTGQDAYGSTVFIRRGTHDLPVPDLAVGRLVGNAATVLGLLSAYTSAGGQVNPGSALVTGYDFVADGAEEVYNNLQTALTPPGGATVDPARLIQPEGLGPNDPSAWSAADLRAQLFNPAQRNDLVFFTGHFAAGSALAADYKTSVLASEVATSGVNFSNTILFGLGCHSGYNIPTADAIPGFSPQPDWALAWAQAQATYIAATGFAYGDTELIEYGERLLVNLSKAMHTGSAPVAIGQALIKAKQDYLAQKASLSGIDEKTLAQFTLYGLPMLRVNLPGKLADPGAAQLVDGVSDVPSGTPGAALGLKVGTRNGSELLTVTSNPVEQTVTLTDTDGVSRVEAVYYEGTGGEVVANPTEPIFPLERREVGVNDPAEGPQILRGVGFRGGAFEDRANLLALTSAPATENARGFLKFLSDTLYPSQPWSANYFDALRGGSAQLFVVPAQYQAGTAGGSMYRVFSSMEFKLFYLDADWPGSPLRAAGLAPAPEIAQVTSERLAGGNVAFSAFVLNGASAVGGSGLGVQEVWVTYSTPDSGHWQSLDLSLDPTDPTRWVSPAAGLNLPDGTVFMVQAAGAAGKVSLDTNSGAYYTVAPTNPVTPPAEVRSTSLAGVSMPTSAPYGSRVTFSLRLSDDQATPAPLAGRSLRLFLGGQTAFAATDATGLASFTLDLAQPPGDYTLQASYLGEAGFHATSLSQSFTITPAATTLALAPTGRLKAYTTTVGLTATLRIAATGAPIADQTVIFVADGKPGRFGVAVKTNLGGQAILGAVPWPKGKYTVTAYYSGNGAPVTGGPASLTIPYQPSQSTSLTLQLKQSPQRNLCYATGAQSWKHFNQGKRKDGRPVPSNRSNPLLAMGLPQKDDSLNYVSLGFGGRLTLVFKNPIVNDGTRAPDIRLWETTPGDATRPWFSFPEAVLVFASADGERWTLIGATTGKDQAYDLVLPEAGYIRLVDVSDRARFSATEDGFDLDGIEVLSGCRPYGDDDD